MKLCTCPVAVWRSGRRMRDGGRAAALKVDSEIPQPEPHTPQAGVKRWRSPLALFWALGFSFILIPQAKAAFIGDYALSQFTLTNTNADGFVTTPDNGLSIILTGGNNGSGLSGTTDFVTTATGAGPVQFLYSYSSFDYPGLDFAGYLLGTAFVQLANTDGQFGTASFQVSLGQSFGFRVDTLDNTGEPGILTISQFSAPSGNTPVPEPGTAPLLLVAAGAMLAARQSMRHTPSKKRTAKIPLLSTALGVLLLAGSLSAQTLHYAGVNATGQLTSIGAVNALQQAQTASAMSPQARAARATSRALDHPRVENLTEHPTLGLGFMGLGPYGRPSSLAKRFGPLVLRELPATAATVPGSTVSPTFNGLGFMGLTHLDDRQANGGNQFSVEPPSPSIAVGNGYVLEGVNNAIQAYTTSGAPLLPNVISTNQLFGLAPAIDRTTNVYGVFPTDMRVFYDHTINRWFVLQRSLDNDIYGNSLNRSHLYIAVSQTGDPTGTYTIYSMDTTHAANPGCPCLPDYPQIGADQYGFYVSANEYNTYYSSFVDATILAISKASLAANAPTPTTYQFVIPITQGYEFTIQPAATPPGASYFLASNGLEYFVSSVLFSAGGSELAIWAMSNTGSLATAAPTLTLTETIIPTLTYVSPNAAAQRPGPLPYGSTLFPPGRLEPIDGGDNRMLAACYAGGRLYATLSTQLTDENGNSVVGAAYVILSPTFRGGVLSAFGLRQGYVLVNNNNLLRPAIAVNPQGNGAIVFTLVGPDYYPSAAFVALNTFSTASTVQIAGPGVLPEDGFTGYEQGIARWGDYSAAVAASDGSIWMATEYIPNAPRTQFANWGTFLIRYTP